MTTLLTRRAALSGLSGAAVLAAAGAVWSARPGVDTTPAPTPSATYSLTPQQALARGVTPRPVAPSHDRHGHGPRHDLDPVAWAPTGPWSTVPSSTATSSCRLTRPA